MSSHIIVSPLLKATLGRLDFLDPSTASTYHELDQINAQLKNLDKLIDDVEQIQHNKASDGKSGSDLLLRLQEVLEGVDNLIDELQMMVSSNNQQSQVTPTQVSFPLSFFNPFSQQEPKQMTQEFQTVSGRLHGIERGVTKFCFDANNKNKNVRSRREDSSIHIGRERDVEAVIDLILNPVAERVSVVPIVGFMGVGKTTLARLIYHDPRIQQIFDLRFWLSRRLGSYDNFDLIREILGKLRHLYGSVHDAKGRRRDAEQLKMELHELLENRRFLIVVDGFEDINLHKSAVTHLRDMGSKGSAIIVTTRRAAPLIGTTPPYQLEPLSEEASYHLLRLLCGGEFQNHPEWEPVARDMVKWCPGVPLFLKAIATILDSFKPAETKNEALLQNLQGRDFSYFIFAFDGDRLKFADHNMPAFPRYLRLPLQSFHLQKTCGMSVEALTCVWMALGFLYSDVSAQPPEHIASKYVGEIVESDLDLCTHVEYAPGGVVRHIKFNEALLGLATFSAGHQWGFVSPRHRSFQQLNAETRYIIWDEDDPSGAPMLVSSPNKVRLFIVCSRKQASIELVNGIISSFKCLRVLGFGGCNIEMLPDSVGKLKHLRYLDVGRNARMKRLPDSICDLWHLQTLFLHGCSQLEELPPNLGRLQNLRYLTLTIIKESLPEELGQLVSLRKLGLSSCPMLGSLPSSIKNLTNLQTLGIVDCPNLDLTTTSSVDGLKGLYAIINTLLLSHLPRFAGLPTVTDLGNSRGTMEHLMIQSCPSVTETRWIAQFRNLRSLTVEDCPQLQDLALIDATSQLDNMLELIIRRCPSLGYTAWIRQFMSLRSLIVDGCPKLVELDAGFSELKNLERVEIRRCPRLSEWFARPAGKAWLPSIHHVRVIELDGARLGS